MRVKYNHRLGRKEKRMKNLLSGLLLLSVLTTTFHAECTKSELKKLIEKGYKKNEIVKICDIKTKSTATKMIKEVKWITPKDSTCHANGGKLNKGICQATWNNAKTICHASDGRLPMIQELIEVINDCAGNMADTDSAWNENRRDTNYQDCYQKKGFSASNIYWSSTSYTGRSGAWSLHFYDGFQYYGHKSNGGYVRCVKNGQ